MRLADSLDFSFFSPALSLLRHLFGSFLFFSLFFIIIINISCFPCFSPLLPWLAGQVRYDVRYMPTWLPTGQAALPPPAGAPPRLPPGSEESSSVPRMLPRPDSETQE
jgi:hypothetical protein